MPQFVILTHDWPAPHWDFLVEVANALRAWRLLAEPTAGTDIPAEPNFDHRKLYLDYEGPVSGGRGNVTRWDSGTCDWLGEDAEQVEIELRGGKVCGRANLRREASGWVFRLTAFAAPG